MTDTLKPNKYYFGYGANRSKQRVTDILKTEPMGGYGAIIEKYALCYQILEQIPEPPHNLLRKVWGNKFRGYTIKPISKGLVAGVLWKLTEDQFQRFNEWECIGSWKKIISIPVIMFDGKLEQAYTEIVTNDQQIFEIVDGLYYENNLNPQGIQTVVNDEYRIKALQKVRAQLKKLEKIV